MAYDGLVTWAVVQELRENLLLGKIEKIYQPEADELVLHLHGKKGNYKLYASIAPDHARVHFIESNPVNPPAPLAFCMLLRKHLQGGRITDIRQAGAERIIEMDVETLNELGFTVSKRLTFEIMGKHSNIILLDIASGKILDAIKRVSIDASRVRQVLPGMVYAYPPAQDKIPFKTVTEAELAALPEITGKTLLRAIGGISPAFAGEMAGGTARRPEGPAGGAFRRLAMAREAIAQSGSGTSPVQLSPTVYLDDNDVPQEFYLFPLHEYEAVCKAVRFDTVSACLAYYFDHRASSNRGRQKANDLLRAVQATLNKLYLKKQRLSEDLLKAENSEDLRLYGELLTANLHLIQPGMAAITVHNYYNDQPITIPLDVRESGAKNAQRYFKRYGKSKTAIKEKQIQLTENEKEIQYLESVLSYLENTQDVAEIDALRAELVETGYLRRRKQAGGYREKKYKPQPHRYTLSNGMTVLVGRNNKENDELTLRLAGNRDLWLHTKDIPGSHVIVQSGGTPLDAEALFEAAAIAAYHSKARNSENVPVDYVPVRYVKKPAGAKPGMVIFTNNHTVWVNPALPAKPNI